MKWISDFLDFIMPRHCAACGELLSRGEQELCLNCLFAMPLIDDAHCAELEKIFWGIVPVDGAASYFYYRKGSPYNNLLHNLKYNNRPQIGLLLANNAAKELLPKGFFDGVELIIPLPLSRNKERSRGYNQCDYIAEGLSRVTGIPVCKGCVSRTKANETQTHKNREERWKNVEGIFSVSQPDAVSGKHVLLVDDVLTTGATISDCARALVAVGCRVKIFTLAYSSNTI